MKVKSDDLSRNFLHGAFILTVAALVTKILSAGYRIPFQNIAGDIGFYIYQQVYPFYAIALILSTYGFPVVISKIIAENQSKSTRFDIKSFLLSAYIILGFIGFGIFIILYAGAGGIAGVMSDPSLAPLIRIISFSFLLLPTISVLRGFYQGMGDMLPTAYSQVGEQLVRVFCILLFSFVLFSQGRSLYEVGAGALFGSLIGGLMSILILLTLFWFRNDWAKLSYEGIKLNFLTTAKLLVIHGVSFCITNLVLVLIQLVDALELYPLLLDHGMKESHAKQWKGVFDRGQPLIQLGTVAITSLSLTLVPLISQFRLQKKEEELNHYVELSLRMNLMLGAASTVGLICIIKPTNIMLFMDDKGSTALGVLAISILFCSIFMTTASILQSMGRSYITVTVVISGIIIKWMLMHLFVPSIGILGASYSTVLSFLWMTFILAIVLRREIRVSLLKAKTILLIGTAIVSMSLVLLLHRFIFTVLIGDEMERGFAALQALTGVPLGAAIYIWVIIRFGLFSRHELSLLPLGSKLSKLLPNKRS
ncbi:putative polysaccharide biosynthesis protein [Peribacillus alkalitolerans]|uniref:putative polysaccharide biosynthesis protein n=1 Tax=Peribacillus alkalitolerans TaxID=1550385 RepID=UPI0013D47D6B|nr:polysaccharide biosynthesis protein [Peribacillus alkalitolerans]